MDAIAILLARRDPMTLLYVMVAYLLPFLLYTVSTGLAFLALADRPDGTGPTVRRGLTALALPVLGAILVLVELGRTPPSPQR